MLLDTHALLWWLADELPPGVTAVIAASDGVLVSSASIWEIEIRRSLGKLEAPEDLLDQLDRAQFGPLPITVEHAVVAGRLPLHHRDPFDRMLIAQAMTERVPLVSKERALDAYGIARIWT